MYFTQYRCKPYLFAMNLSVLFCTFLPTSMYLVFEGCLWIEYFFRLEVTYLEVDLQVVLHREKCKKGFQGNLFLF